MTDLAAAPQQRTSSLYVGYVIALMAGVYFMSFVDRQIIAILMPKIQAEFKLNDTEMGLLIGPAFGLLYAFLAIPLATLGDRFNRRNIIAACVGLYSVATLLGGFISQFPMLLITRLGVGAGQAGTTPSVNSILSDIVPPEKRAGAMAIGAASAKLGLIAALLVGGWVGSDHGWRTAMIVVGIPGLILTALLLLTVKEPTRGVSENRKDTGTTPPFMEAMRILYRCRTYRNSMIGLTLVVIVSANMILFMPSFFARSHHMTLKEVSVITSAFTLIGVISTSSMGVIADWLCKKDERWMLYLPGWLQIICVPFYPFLLLSNDLTFVIIVAIVPMICGGGAYTGPLFASTQNVVPLRTRAVATGILLFISGIFGSILGPQLVGWVSDLLAPTFGIDSLRWSMLIVFLPCLLFGGAIFIYSARTMKEDMARAREQG